MSDKSNPLQGRDAPLMVEFAISNIVTRAFHAGAVAADRGHDKYKIIGKIAELKEQAQRELFAALPGRAFFAEPSQPKGHP